MTFSDSESLPEQEILLRQARLRLASAPLYPMLPIGEWLLAADLASRVQGEVARIGEDASPSKRARILPEEHFEFRRGRQEASIRQHNRAKTRWTDHPSPPDR